MVFVFYTKKFCVLCAKQQSDKCEKYCIENAKITNGYKPLATTIDKMLPIIMSDEGIFINPNENEILGKDVGLAFLSSILKRK